MKNSRDRRGTAAEPERLKGEEGRSEEEKEEEVIRNTVREYNTTSTLGVKE